MEYHIDVEKTSLGKMLGGGLLRVPPYQREYSWKSSRVKKLFDDIDAMIRKARPHFLGTLVLTSGPTGSPPSVVDGQQRLATTTIFFAAIRDHMLSIGRSDDAKSIDDDFLHKYDRNSGEFQPRLLMNVDDRQYMKDRILTRPDERIDNIPRPFTSHRRIDTAATIAAERVAKIVANADSHARQAELLNEWVNFIDENALVVTLTPPDSAGAYQMFKTLNDRAQRTTQADMIKNHLFEHAGDAVDEAQSKWSSTRTTIEGLDNSSADDPVLSYLHHVSIVFNGPVKADEIFELMEDNLSGKASALTFLDALASYASDYAAILTPTHSKWSGYDQRVRFQIDNISTHLRLPFIRPLMLAVASRFPKKEAHRAFRLFTSWVVRFLIAGGSRSGTVINAIGTAAHGVSTKQITTAQQIVDQLSSVVPTDVRFRSAFQSKTLTTGRHASFILRELEAQARTGNPDELLEPVLDKSKVSLEHILPKNVNATGWEHFSDDERRLYRHRIGNMVLLNTKDNGAAGDRAFSEKRPIINRSSNIVLTKDVIDRTDEDAPLWDKATIDARQSMLVDLAVKRWPIS